MALSRSILLLAAAMAIMPGCRARIPIDRDQTAPARASPVVRGSGAGLETWYWVVSDQRIPRRVAAAEPLPTPLPPPGSGSGSGRKPAAGSTLDQAGPPAPAYTIIDGKRDIEEVLAPYADRPIPLPEDVIQRWTASGLRFYSIPRADLDAIESRVRLIAPVQRQWLGEVPAWTNLADGPWSESALSLYIAGDTVRLDPGRVRLLARAWTAPLPTPTAEGPRPSLRLELIPQHEPAQAEADRLLLSAALPTASEDRGLRFDRLAAGLSLTTDDALIIVPTPRPGPEEPARPFRDPPRSLGDAMLTREGTEETPRARAVIVILPHIAQSFKLLR